jgi:hypothetical protein
MLRALTVEWKHVKSYATEAALAKRLNEDKGLYPDNDDRYIVCRTPEGRWTAIVVIDRATGGYAGRYEFLKV